MGMIFDVLRFSLNDGPGIRTTVFFKGCPLRCLWCHNPESLSARPQLSFDASRCTGCGQCLGCPRGVHSFDAGRHEVDFSKCTACGLCVPGCPGRALKIYGYEATAEEIVDLAARDMPYYEASGGGLTLSGGEPMAQPEFALEILQKAKGRGIGTAIETSGYAGTEKFAAVLPYADWFLYDYKAERSLHKKLTGVDSGLIIKNLAFLCEHGANVVLRCPIVPHVNENEKALEAFVKAFPQIKSVERLPYHDLGVGKAKNIGASGAGSRSFAPTGAEGVRP